MRSMEGGRPRLDVGSETTLAEVPTQLQDNRSDMHAETLSQATWLPSIRFAADLPNDERPQCLRTQRTRLLSVLPRTALSKRAPEKVLLAVRGAHPSLRKTETTRA